MVFTAARRLHIALGLGRDNHHDRLDIEGGTGSLTIVKYVVMDNDNV